MKNKKVVDSLKELLVPIGAIFLGLLVGAVIILMIGHDPIEAYIALFQGAFGDPHKFANTLARSTPLIFTGLAVAFAFRCGLFNIGVEGQMFLGALVSAYVGVNLSGLPKVIHLPLTILSGMAAGGFWAFIPGILKAKREVHEVINTIMMNFISYALIAYMITGPMMAPGQIPRTLGVLPSAQLTRLSEVVTWSNSKLNTGFIIALLACAIIYYLLWKTTIGYEVRAVGHNPHAAEYGGINSNQKIVLAMVISGALAGLAGVERVLGFDRALILGFSPGFGFEGVAVALLGRKHPVGVVMAALLFGALSNGGSWMNFNTSIPVDLISVLQAVIIFFVAADEIVRSLMKFKKKGKGVA